MKFFLFLAGFLFVYTVLADTPPPGSVTALIQDSAGNNLNSTSNALNTFLTGGSITANNASVGTTGVAAPTSSTQIGGSDGTDLRALFVNSTGQIANPVGAATNAELITINSTLGSPFQSGGSIGNTSFGISGNLPGFASTPTFNLGTLNGAATNAELVTINSTLGSPFQSGGSIGNTSFGVSGTLPPYAATPTFNLGTLNGAATATLQSSTITALGSPFQAGGSIGNTSFAATQSTASSLNATVVGPSGVAIAKDSSLTTINTTLGTPFQASGNIGNTSFGATQATASNLNATVVTTAGATVATAANQTTGNTSLSTIATNTGSSPTNANATLSARQTVTGSETSLAAPSNAVGVLFECESLNADSLRWGFSSSSGAILSSTLGVLCEPGRDTGFLPLGAGTFLHMISTGAGSDFADVQWILAR